MASTVHQLADGSVERWDPIVGRWRIEAGRAVAPVAAKPAASTAGEVRQARAAHSLQTRPVYQRMYASARASRLTVGFGSGGNSSADAELSSSLPALRARSRQMVRDACYAKRAKLLVVNNIIGGGIGLQAQVFNGRGDKLNERINADIERAHAEWAAADSCHTGGALHLHDLERAALGQVFDAGEVLVRMHYRRFGQSQVPLALELIEAERLVHDNFAVDGDVRMGVEVDRFGRALAYHIRQGHPGDLRAHSTGADRIERIPASEVFHLRLIDRWPQTRGEPWMHTALRKLDDMNEYSGSELMAARASAYYFATLKTPPNSDNPLAAPSDSESQVDIEPLTVQTLEPGEELDFHSPNRPNAALDPFMRYMLREFSAGVGPSYESISRDYSQSNYSSSRMGLLDDRDLWRVLQQWWLRSFRVPLYARWVQQAVLAGAVPTVRVEQYAANPQRYTAALFKPRGWTWVDPTKEVSAYKEAIKGGMTTLTDVIAATAGGLDIDDMVTTRKRELQLLADAGIAVDTTVSTASAAPDAKPNGEGPPGDPGSEPEDDSNDTTNDPPARVVSFAR